MRRRGVTVILGALITALLAAGVMVAPMPYVVLKPGPTVNTLGLADGRDVIQVGKGETSKSTGELRLTTVNVQSQVELFWAIRGWLSDSDAVVPRELIYPPNRSEQQVQEQNAQDWKESQTSAERVALRELGYPEQIYVGKITDDSPADGVLQVDDVLVKVDGTAITRGDQVSRLVQGKPAGTVLTIDYERAGKAGSAQITSKADAVGGKPRIGIELGSRQTDPLGIEIDLDKIGGPSAGLMFTLGIIDKIKPEDLTGGKVIAGTGTIDDDGNVGPIGGIPQKLVGAERDGAKLFLVPKANCAEALRNARPGLTMAEVATVDDALTALKTFTAGNDPKPCSAS